MKLLTLSLITAILSLTLVPARLQTSNRGGWTTLAPMPSLRQEISTAVLDGKIYVIGGFINSGASTSTVEVYDPQTNTWSPAPPIPIVTNHNAAAVAAGKLYSFGGNMNPSNRAFVYNPQMNRWDDVAPSMFQHDQTPAVGVFNDKIYVAGGAGPNMNQTELEAYDPSTNTWTLLAPMSIGRNHTAGAFINGKFYVVGGRDGPNSANALEVYDPSTNRWTRLADMPTGRSGIGAAAVNGELYVFGGEIPQLHSEVEVYNPLNNTWQSLPPMPTPRHGIFASVIGNAVYIPAGGIVQGLGTTNVNEVFTVNTATTVSAASFAGKLASKAIVTGFGAGLATTTLDAPSQPLPTNLGGTTVRVTDSQGVTRLSPLFYISPLQINYQLPPDTAAGPAVVTVTSGDDRVSTGAIQVINAAPALFTASQNGQGAAIALDAFTFTGPPFNAARANGEPNVLAFFGTGLGADATDIDGNVNASVQVRVDANPVIVLYAGRTPGFTGLNQLNVALPVGIGAGTHTVQVSRDAVTSNSVTIEIR
jgi:uncharacterized protein (TIGR03437 family)